MERGALVDRMFYSIQLAFRRVPASLAVATLIVCTFWGIASGLVGAVVVLMGVIAMRPMLKAGYDVRLASGVITAGGTLGILIPPSVMIIVYAAVAGQSVVKLYASAMLPGFFLAFLYLLYILGWALINPKVAPRLPEAELHPEVPAWLKALPGRNVLPGLLATGRLRPFTMALVPLALAGALLATTWWYVVVHKQTEAREASAAQQLAAPADESGEGLIAPVEGAEHDDDGGAPPPAFYWWFWGTVAGCAFGIALALPSVRLTEQFFIPWIYTPSWYTPFVVAASLAMCALASVVSIRKALSAEPARVFRA